MRNLDPGAVFFLGEVRTMLNFPGSKKRKGRKPRIISMSYRQFKFIHYIVLSRKFKWSMDQCQLNATVAKRWLRNSKLRDYRTMLEKRAHRRMIMNPVWLEEQIYKSITDKSSKISPSHIELIAKYLDKTEGKNTHEYDFLTKESPGSPPQLPAPSGPDGSGEKPSTFRISDGGQEIRQNQADASPPPKSV